MLKRMMMLLAVAALMAAMLAFSAVAAFAKGPPPVTGGAAENGRNGAYVVHCQAEGFKGNVVVTPSGNENHLGNCPA